MCVCSSLPTQRPAGSGLLHAPLAHWSAAVDWPHSARQGGGREREVREPRVQVETVKQHIPTWTQFNKFSLKVHEGRPGPVEPLLRAQFRFRWVLLRCCSAPNKWTIVLHRPLLTRVSPVAQLHFDPTWLQWWACSTRSSRTTRRWRLVSVRLWSSWRQHRSSPSSSRWRPVGPGTRSSSFKQQSLVFSRVSEACSHFYFPWQKRKAVSFSGKRVKLLLDCDVNGN